MRCKCSKHNQIKKCTANAHNATNQINALQKQLFIWLCCEQLLCISLFGCVVSICCVCVVKLMFSWFAGAFSICMCFLKLQCIAVHSLGHRIYIWDKTTESHILLLAVSKHMFYQIKRTALLEFIPLFDKSISIGTVELNADVKD